MFFFLEAGILHLSVTVVDLVSSSEHRPQPLQGVFVLVLSFNFNFLELQKRGWYCKHSKMCRNRSREHGGEI